MIPTQNPVPGPLSGSLMDLQDALVAIRSGAYLSIAADAALLRRLPPGNWIAGSIPYFMAQEGGRTSRQQLFVTELPTHAGTPHLRWYDMGNLHKVALEAPAHGLTVLIVPAFSDVHSRFAREAPAFEDLYMKPLVGWIAGVHLDELGQTAPVVANGQSLVFSSDRALAIHIPLPSALYPRIDILNLFRPGPGDTIRFPSTGFSAQECFVNGELVNLAQYLHHKGIDTRLPLVADYSGAMINVSFKSVDTAAGRVDFYAPVFDDVTYRIAEPVADYAQAFARALPAEAHGARWSCNCILNYLYGGLEGQRTGPLTGPMTFGEIAYQLLNQTLVYVNLEKL